MKGHNYDHGKGSICRKCNKYHKPTKGTLGKKFPKSLYPKMGWRTTGSKAGKIGGEKFVEEYKPLKET